MTPAPGKLRIAFLGDSITLGDGDEDARGWPSRLLQATSPAPHKTHCYNLGIGGDTISGLSARCQAELQSRLAGRDGTGVVVMIGVNDALRAAAITAPVPLDLKRIEAALTNIIDVSRRFGPVLFIQPAPVSDRLSREDGASAKAVMARLVSLNQLTKTICDTRDVALYALTKPLQRDPAYTAALNQVDGLHPAGSGYDRIAKVIGASACWGHFLNRLGTGS